MANENDPFDDAYARGVTRGLAAAGRGRAAKPAGPKALTALAPSEAVALGGQVITPDGARKGWVVVAGGVIDRIVSRKPSDARPIDTKGVILPGLIDLHGHPEYNVFSAWEPPKSYVNRGAWRGSKEYGELIKVPWHQLTTGGKATSAKAAMARYAEIRALVGGVTAIQGASDTYPKPVEALVRNVDLEVLGHQVARSTIDIGRLDDADAARIKDAIKNKEVTAHYVHLAEGKRGNKSCLTEYRDFTERELLTEASVVIHASALDRAQLGNIADHGAKLVWSPQSNLRLYGETTDIASALDVGLTIGLGADWLPSGSRSTLDELRVARRSLVQQGVPQTAQWLVSMVTDRAAAIAGLGDLLGSLLPKRVADLTVVQAQHDDPYESVLAADPSTVELVMVGGDAAYGTQDLVTQLIPQPVQYEPLLAWGRPMLLDTGYVRLDQPLPTPVDLPTLDQIRAKLIARYAKLGPIFA